MGALVGPRLATIATQRMASRRLLANEIGPAQWWLAWAAWFDSGDYRTDLLQASCERQRSRQDRWEERMRQARRKGRQRTAGTWNLDWDGFSRVLEEGEEERLREPELSGESQCDVATALFLGYLARGDADRARRVLEELPHDVCEEAHREYLWGVYCATAAISQRRRPVFSEP